MPGKYSLGIFGLLMVGLPAWGQGKAYRLPSTSLKEQVIWGSRCELPDGTGLAFGGQDQLSADGRPHTRIKVDGKWQAIHLELQKNNPFRLHHTVVKSLARLYQNAAARARHVYFQGHPRQTEVKLAKSIKVPYQDCKTLVGNLEKLAAKAPAYEAGQALAAVEKLKRAGVIGEKVVSTFPKGITPETIKQLSAAQIALEQAAEYLGSEPPPRALSTIVHDAQTKNFVLFGGDHLDFLRLFNPAKKKWLQQHPPSAPPPRANHQVLFLLRQFHDASVDRRRPLVVVLNLLIDPAANQLGHGDLLGEDLYSKFVQRLAAGGFVADGQ